MPVSDRDRRDKRELWNMDYILKNTKQVAFPRIGAKLFYKINGLWNCFSREQNNRRFPSRVAKA